MAQRLLRDPYYTGKVVYKRGTPDEERFEGRHEPLIDQDTFDSVQRLLSERQTAGERAYKHRHYLKGSIFCGECGRRLSFGISTGKAGGRYPYFFCSTRTNRESCAQRVNIPPALIERAIERYYRQRPVELTPQDVAERAAAIEGLAAASQQAVAQVKAAKSELIDKLKAQQVRLLRLHTEEGDEFSPDAFRAERARLQTEIAAAEESLAETETRLQVETDQLRMALELAEDVATVYAEADESTKRSLNQAFFTKLYVLPDYDEGNAAARIDGAELTEPFAFLLADETLRAIGRELQKAESGPDEPLSPTACSMIVQMAGLTGRLSKHGPLWERIRELHAQRFGTPR